MRKLSLLLWGVTALALIIASCFGRGSAGETLILATTTSTYDSGLLDYVLPPFEQANKVKVKVIAVGTGEALELGKRGDADMLLVHAKDKEEEFIAQGYGVDRQEVMYNDFIILGSLSDPAKVEGMKNAADALAKIAHSQFTFISRGDNSGTHTKELSLWAKAGVAPGDGWYKPAGQGMGETLTIANEMGAYTLSDRATYLSRQAGLELVILVEGDPLLFNPYGIIAINPQRNPHVKYELARKLIEYMTSYETQEMIGQYRKYGEVLFYPNSEEWQERQASQ